MRRQILCVVTASFLTGLVGYLFLPGIAAAQQQQSAGVVTGVQGQAQLTRSAAKAAPLRFNDGVVIRDVVDTKEKSLARILFGGRSTVTVRELSRLEVREELLPGGARRDVHDLSSGAVLVNVARQLMRPGDEVQIRTPNAVAAIRGSTVFGSYNAITRASFFAILSGFGLITPVGLQPITVTANTQNNGANVSGTGPGVQANAVNVPVGQLNQILAESTVSRVVKEEAKNIQAAVKEAAALATIVIETVTKSEQQSTTSESKQTTTSDSSTSSNTAPVVADTSSSTTPSSTSTAPKGLITFGTSSTDFPGVPAGTTIQYFNNGKTGVLSSLPTANSTSLARHQSALTNGGNALALTGSDSFGSVSCPGGCGVLLTFDALQNKVSAVGNDFGGDSVNDNEVVHLTLFDSNGNKIGDATKSAPHNSSQDLKEVTFTSSSANIKYAAFTWDVDLGYYSVDDIDPPDPMSLTSVDLSDGSAMTYLLAEPYMQIDNRSFSADGDLIAIRNGSSLDLQDSLLSATNADVTVGGDLVEVSGGASLTTAANPVVLLNGGAYDVEGHLFNLSGVNTDSATGLGTDQPIAGAGLSSGLLKVTGGAEVDAGGSALRLDTALLEATAPIISLLGTESAQSGLTTQQSSIDLIKAKVTSTGPVIAMDKSFINVTNGALINLTHGSNMTVLGDLIRMMSGSKINVVNGPLVSVAGAGSLLDVSGALVNFGGTGGNKIIVNNSIAPTATLGGLPVSATLGGSVSLTNPVKNQHLGQIQVSGSLISATNGGTVNVQGK